MKGRTLAVLVLVGLALVGWAVYALVGGENGSERASKPAAANRRADARRSSKSAVPVERRDADEEPAAERPAAAPERPAAPRLPPEPAKPNMTIEEAREKFDAFIAELDREIAKSEETDRDLSNEAWVEYYRRGHEAMDPLRRLLDPKDPEQAQEVADKYELVRKKLQELEPRPRAPD